MIKAAIFDLCGVTFKDGRINAAQKISSIYGTPISEILQVFGTNSKLVKEYRKGNISMDEFWNESKKLLKIEGDNKELNKIWVECYHAEEGTIDILKQLKKDGIKLSFLSDNVPERVAHIKTSHNLYEYFIDGIFSFETHSIKSEGTGMFEMALEKTGMLPEEVLYIDDNEKYVETAKIIGMHGIHFKNPEQLSNELVKLGVLKKTVPPEIARS